MRININYVLDSDCENWAREVNQRISSLIDNEIDFSITERVNRPHITLLMCDVNEKDLPKVEKIVKSFSSAALNKTFEFSPPYIKGAYIFVDVKDNTLFKQDCDCLLNALEGLITPHRYLISNGNPPHITLGYSNEAEKLTDFISSITTVPSATLNKIKVSQTGEHGTVLENHNVLKM